MEIVPVRTLIFGATGMLGQALMRQAQARGLDVIGSGPVATWRLI